MLTRMSNKLLEQLGFSEREIRVYITLLKRGPMKPAELAKATGINRTTLYSLAKKLVAKGIVAEDATTPSAQLIPNNPKKLADILSAERKQLSDKEKLVKQAISDLSKITNEAEHPIPKMQFITEKEVERFLYTQSRTWNESAEKVDNTWWGFQDHELVESRETYIHWLWKHIYNKDQHVKLFSNASGVEKKMKSAYPRRQIRVLEDSSQFTATVWVMGNYIVMFNTKEEPNYLVEIHDATLAQNMRATFKYMWENL